MTAYLAADKRALVLDMGGLSHGLNLESNANRHEASDRGWTGVFERSESRFECLPSLGRIELDTLDLEPCSRGSRYAFKHGLDGGPD